MSSLTLVSEEEATGRTKELFEEIKETLGIEFVPNLYRVMAPNRAFLEAKWDQVKTVMQAEGELDRLTKEIIALAVSAVSGCDY
jgi:alkylhydroperoxidase/carboxymuconolactone decarboxylase family protein YurZ